MTEKYDESPIFERCAPEEQGISSRHIASFLNRLDRCGYNLHSLQLFRNGKVLYAAAAAPFTLTCPHRMFSAAKAVISLSVLFAIQEKKLRFEDPVIRYFRDVLPAAPSALLEKMTVYDLLTMQTGMEKDPFPLLFQDEDADLIRPFFQTEVEHAPGSGFKYNNTVPHILYTLTERAVGEPFEQYQQSRLCDPLRIRITVQYNKNGGYNPLTTVMSNEALLRIGVLYTRGGRWQGKQLLDEALVRYATSYHVPTQKNRRTWQEESGYGMQVMRNSYGGFRLPGGFGQFAICLPEDDLTVSIMSADERIAPPLDAFREEIYANMQKKPLPPDPAAEKELADATERFNLAARIQAPVPSALDFPLGKEIRFLRNSFGLESLLVEQQDNGLLLHARISGENKVFRCGLKQQWQENGARFLIPADLSLRNRIYAVNPSVCRMSGAWADASSLLLLQQCPSEMSQSLVRLRWKDSLLTLELFRNDHLGRAEPSDGAATQTLKGELS